MARSRGSIESKQTISRIVLTQASKPANVCVTTMVPTLECKVGSV